RAVKLLWNALFIHAMSGFVHHAKQRRIEKVLVKASRDAHVTARKAGAERMHRHILPSALEIEAECLHHVERELALFVDVVMLVQNRVAHLMCVLLELSDMFDTRKFMHV